MSQSTFAWRFLKKVNVEGEHLIWTGALKGGMPVLWMSRERGLVNVRRWHFEQVRGRKLDQSVLLYSNCGVQRCIHPPHLRLRVRGWNGKSLGDDTYRRAEA